MSKVFQPLKLQIQLNIYFGPIVPNLPAWSFGYLTYQHHTQLFYFGNRYANEGCGAGPSDSYGGPIDVAEPLISTLYAKTCVMG